MFNKFMLQLLIAETDKQADGYAKGHEDSKSTDEIPLEHQYQEAAPIIQRVAAVFAKINEEEGQSSSVG